MKDEQWNYQSAVLNRRVPVRALIPSGNDLKCLVLLHGYGGDQDQWCRQSRIRELAWKYDLAVLMPACGDDYYEDISEDIPKFLGEELPAYARTVLPIAGGREVMAIGGVSMGGFGALLVGSRYGLQFGKIASLSGAFIVPDVVIGNQGVLGNADPNYFKRIFGDFETLEGSDRDPAAEAFRAAERGELPKVYLLCGNRDVLYRENRKIAQTLEAHRAQVIWDHADGGHTWDFWNSHLEDIIRWVTGATI